MTLQTWPVLLGYTPGGKPIYHIAGGAPITAEPDDDDFDDGSDGDDGPAASTTTAPPMPGVPAAAPAAAPTVEDLQAQLERSQAANRRNNAELTQRRHVQKFMDKAGVRTYDELLAKFGIDPDGNPVAPAAPEPAATAPEPTAATEPAPVDETEIERRVRAKFERDLAQKEERAAALTEALRSTAIQAALTAAKFTGTFEKALLVMDLSRVDVEEDGKVTGVEAAVQGLREEIPEWFRREAPPPPPRRQVGVDRGDKRQPAARPPTWEQRAADRMIRGR